MLLKCAGMNVGVTQENLFYRGPPYKRQAHLVYEATTTLSMEVWPVDRLFFAVLQDRDIFCDSASVVGIAVR